MVALNTDQQTARILALPTAATRYTLTAALLEDHDVMLTGSLQRLEDGDVLPRTDGERLPAGDVILPPASITFLAFPEAGNPS